MKRWFIVSEVMYSGHLQSVGAAGVVAISAALLGVGVTIDLLLVPFLVFQSIYYYDRYRDIDRDETTNKNRTMHLRQYWKFIPVIVACFLLAAAMINYFFGNISGLALMVFIMLMGFLYPVVFKRVTTHVPLFKNIYVASVFAILTMYPLIYRGMPIELTSLPVSLFMFVLGESLITQVFLDIKDSSIDSQYRLLTVPAMIGRQPTLYFLTGASVVVLLTTIITARFYNELSLLIPLAIGSFLFNGYVLWSIAARHQHASVIAAGKYLLWPIIIFLL